jgi:Stigma-specific protein, Stig1
MAMDREWLPGLIRILDAQRSRRGVTGILSGILAARFSPIEDATAKRRKKKKRKKPQSPPPLVCTGGTVNCDGVCVDLQTDEAHCGSCQTVCAANEVCQAGVCFIRGICPVTLANPSFCASDVCSSGANLCKCTVTTEGNVVCANNEIFCPTPTPCVRSDDCSNGRVCIDVGGCCDPPGLPVGTKTCLLPCPNPA